MIVANATKPAKIPPTIAPVLLDFFDVSPDAGSEEFVLLPVPLVEVEDADEVAVSEGALDNETGDWASRHVAMFEALTCKMSELPPFRPFESVIINRREVPSATFAVQENDVDPTGGFKINDVPPGTTPCTQGK